MSAQARESAAPRTTPGLEPRHRSRAVLILAAASVATGIGTILGLTFWPFVIFSLATAAVGIAPRVGLIAGIAYPLTWTLVWILWCTTLGAGIPIPLGVLTGAAFVACVVVGVVSGRVNESGHPRRRVDGWVAAAVAVPGLVCAAAMAAGGTLFGPRVAWAMNGDAQYNTVLARLIVEHNGVTSEYFEVPSLAQSVLAVTHIPGRNAVPQDALLIHDLQGQAQLWTAVIVVSSGLFGLIAASELADARRVLRIVGVLGAGSVPLLWYLTAFSLESGFYNTSLALLVLALVWIAWERAIALSPWGIASLGATVTLALAAWTPIAVIPAGLLLVTIVVGAQSSARNRLVRSWPIWLSAAQLLGYGLGIALPALLGHSDGLSAVGRMFALPEMLFPLLATMLILGTVIAARTASLSTAMRLGVPVVVVTGTIGLLYLVWVNLTAGAAWRYYSIKFAWLVTSFFIVLLIIGIVKLIDATADGRLRSALAVVAAAVMVWSITSVAPLASHGGLGSVPLLSVARNGSPEDPAVTTLSAQAGSRTMYLDYSIHDTFMNQWLFQLGSDGHKNDVWVFAYTAVRSPSDACDAAETWGGNATVYTASESTGERIESLCDGLIDVIVQTRPAGWGAPADE